MSLHKQNRPCFIPSRDLSQQIAKHDRKLLRIYRGIAMTYTGSPMTTERYLHMVTDKGLHYIINNNPNPEEIRAARQELKRRRDAKPEDILPERGAG